MLRLSRNKLTRFESHVFRDVILQMSQSRGIIDVSESKFEFFVCQFKLIIIFAHCLYGKIDPFDCQSDPCHLAWIIHDNRFLFDKLMAVTWFGLPSPRCSNGTSFKELDRRRFYHCEFQGK